MTGPILTGRGCQVLIYSQMVLEEFLVLYLQLSCKFVTALKI